MNKEGELKKRIRLFMATNMPNGYLEGYGLHQVTDLDKMLDEARKEFLTHSCETCHYDLDKTTVVPSKCYIARHQYPSWCPKDRLFLKWLGELEVGSLGSGKEGDKIE